MKHAGAYGIAGEMSLIYIAIGFEQKMERALSVAHVDSRNLIIIVFEPHDNHGLMKIFIWVSAATLPSRRVSP